MSRQELNAKLAAVITTLAETNGSLESMLYIFFDMNMDTWMRIRELLITSDIISIKGNYVTLTEKGKSLASEIEARLKK